MEHWNEIPLNKNNEVELLTTENISLYHGTFLICEGGSLSLTAKSLRFRPPQSKIKWSLDLKTIENLRREPSGYLSSGKIHFQVGVTEGNRGGKGRGVWQCQVCEEINESTEGDEVVKCSTCGSIQKGKLLEVDLDAAAAVSDSVDVKVPWKCEVCEEINEPELRRCHSCGFPASEIKGAEIKEDESKNEIHKWKCSACTFINCDGNKCEVCGFIKPAVQPAKPKYKLSFKSGGSTEFFNKLQVAWREVIRLKNNNNNNNNNNKNQQEIENLTVGISGLLRRQEEKNLAAEASLSTAFSDLDALMRIAGEMVVLAGKISEKMALREGERNVFNDLVESLGIIGEDHEEQLENEKNDHNNLAKNSDCKYDSIARNISSLLQAMIQKTGTRVYSLADVFCIYNRTRTTGSLIAPADLLKAARRLSRLAAPFRLHKFTQKGVLCLVPAEEVDPNHLYTLITQILTEKSQSSSCPEAFLTALDLSHRSKISLLLAEQQLLMAEMTGRVMRDGKRRDLPAFYANKLISFE